MNVRRIWKSKETPINDEQIRACGNDKILAVLLKNRGIETAEQIKMFLNPLKTTLTSPDVFVDMQKAADRIKLAIDRQEAITIFGDFDADGITSTSLLYLTLKRIGANVSYYIPDRANESHGLNTKALVQIIAKRKSKLIITVDCGISNISEVNFAKGFNADIIITDHHEAPEILPNAFAIINPKAPSSLNEDLNIEELKSLNNLAGVGVAFKLACKLLEIYNCQDFVHKILPLAAIGTIGDVVELIGENRTIVAMGIELLKRGKHKGIQKIISSIGIEDTETLTSENIAFGIVPRINAAGRLESPITALNVLISDDDNEIEKAVKVLNDLNALRQELCEETFIQAKEMYEKEKYTNKNSIILFNNNWHIGIIGIVASKLVEYYNRPVFLMTKDANTPSIIRCSCRSIQDINVYEVLSQHKDLFLGFGGHKMAAGFSFDENTIRFEDFKKLLNQSISEAANDVDFSKITTFADMVIEPDEITLETIENINKMQPFGEGNKNPLFIINDLVINQFRMMGQKGNHLKVFVSKNNSENIECIKWDMPNFNPPEKAKMNILCFPKINTFNGNISIQFMIEDIQADFIKQEKTLSDIKLLDHRNKKDILNQVIDFVCSTKKRTGIFINSSKLKKQFENNESINNLILNSETSMPDIEQLMFFDCPVNVEEFTKTIHSTNPQTVHLMNFNVSSIQTDSFLSTLSGMIKYAISNFSGHLDIIKISKALSVNEETIYDALTLFESEEMTDLVQLSETEYKITYLNTIELSKLKQNELYSKIEEDIENINQFRKFYLNSSIEEIKNLLQGVS